MFSSQSAKSDGTLTRINLSLKYLSKDDIFVYVNDVQLPSAEYSWSWTGDDVITFNKAIENDQLVTIRRITPLERMRHVFAVGGAVFKDQSVDDNFKQLLYQVQEFSEGSVLTDLWDDLNMHGFRVRNIGNPVDSRDAITLGWYQADKQGVWDTYRRMQEFIAYAEELNEDTKDYTTALKQVLASDDVEEEVLLPDGTYVPTVAKRAVDLTSAVTTVNGQVGAVEIATFEPVASIAALKQLKPVYGRTTVLVKSFHGDATAVDEYAVYDASLTTFDEMLTFKSDVAAGGWKWSRFTRIVQCGVRVGTSTAEDATILNVFDTLRPLGLRQDVVFDKGIKFSIKPIYNAAPLGWVLRISEYVNYGQSAYFNKFDIKYSNDLVNDDTSMILASNHHPAIHLLNTGASGSHSGVRRAASILHSVGVSYNNDPLNAAILQFTANDTNTKWCTQIRSLIPYDIAMKDPSRRVANRAYAVGDMCLGDNNRVYVVTTAGTTSSSTTLPSGTGTGIVDGTVVWAYRAEARSRDNTIFLLDEDGNLSLAGALNTRLQVSGSTKRMYIEVNATSGDINMYDVSRGRSMLVSSTARGVYSPTATSYNFTTLTNAGATPACLTGAAVITNTNATTITNITTGEQTYSNLIVLFRDNNTTLRNGSFQLRGGVDVNPPVNGVMRFFKVANLSSSWFEESRNF